MYLHWQAGGGYGDPIRRDLFAVARDVAENKVSASAACDLFGVVFAEGSIEPDAVATYERRDEYPRRTTFGGLRGFADRWSCVGCWEHHRREPDPRRDRRRLRDRVRTLQAADCSVGRELSRSSRALNASPSEGGPLICPEPSVYLDTDVRFRQFYCPGCYTAIQTSVSPVSHPVLTDRGPAVPEGSPNRVVCPHYDPLDPESSRDPYPGLAELRASEPLSAPAPGFWFVSRHPDVREALLRHKTYSNVGNFQLENEAGTAFPAAITMIIRRGTPRSVVCCTPRSLHSQPQPWSRPFGR